MYVFCMGKQFHIIQELGQLISKGLRKATFVEVLHVITEHRT